MRKAGGLAVPEGGAEGPLLMGSVKRNVAPSPGSLSALIEPPSAWMVCFASARPSPVPLLAREVSAL